MKLFSKFVVKFKKKMKPNSLTDEQYNQISSEISDLRKDISEMKDITNPDNVFQQMTQKVDQLISLVSEIKAEMEAALFARSRELKKLECEINKFESEIKAGEEIVPVIKFKKDSLK